MLQIQTSDVTRSGHHGLCFTIYLVKRLQQHIQYCFGEWYWVSSYHQRDVLNIEQTDEIPNLAKCCNWSCELQYVSLLMPTIHSNQCSATTERDMHTFNIIDYFDLIEPMTGTANLQKKSYSNIAFSKHWIVWRWYFTAIPSRKRTEVTNLFTVDGRISNHQFYFIKLDLLSLNASK